MQLGSPLGTGSQPMPGVIKFAPDNTRNVAANGMGRSQKNNTSINNTIGMPAATYTRSQPMQGNRVTTQSGSDNLFLRGYDTAQIIPMGEAIVSAVVTAHATSRLSKLSTAFQRIKWQALTFSIEGAFPSIAGGGYVACFVRDPSDVPPQDPAEAVRWAMAQECCADAKWYDNVVVRVPASPDLLYTSEARELRLSSPGRLFVISKAGPNQPGSLTVNMNWSVVLSEPTIDSETQEVSVPIATQDYYLAWDGAHDRWLSTVKDDAAAHVPSQMYLTAATPADMGLVLSHGDRIKAPSSAIVKSTSATSDEVMMRFEGYVCVGTPVGDRMYPYYVNAGNRVIAVKALDDITLPLGYAAAVVFSVMAGYGPVIWRGEIFDVYEHNQVAVAEMVDVFSPKGIIKRPTGKMIKVPEVTQLHPEPAQVDLSGEH